ncbi:hypothetical protein F0562_006840 [Nyssa sinensis]|uniref:CSC1/OSCA1-like cytosolic domain-containing protein n=1 Tax=Nyssa sinensis TaxID=561372 RepID=A0A5J5AP93_9ASTE|nr:hypothetical protein F0562_006840 [Nyssa sinensis]
MAPLASIIMNYSISPPPSPSGDDADGEFETAWYGNMQYLLNISAIGAFTCVLIFFLVKLRSDHRRMPGPTAIASKLLAVWHATSREIARHCGADAAQFLFIEGGSCAVLLAMAILSMSVMLPLNFYAGSAAMDDQFSKTTANHITKGSPLLWIHFVFVIIVVVLVHFGINAIEERLRITRFRDGYGNISDPNANSTAIFTIMVQGVPKSLGFDRTPLIEYIQHKYPGKVYRVILPMDLCALDDLVTELVKVREDITRLVARIESRVILNGDDDDIENGGASPDGLRGRVIYLWRRVNDLWEEIANALGFSDEERLRKLQELRAELETEMAAYKEGRARGAGVAFVVFKDVYTANKAIQDFCNEKKRRIGKFFSIMELQLQRNQWKVERAPLATDIYWNHLGSTKLSLKIRRVFVNTCLLLMLLFFSSPLAVISAIKSAGRIINAEAMDNAQMWLAWVQSSSWLGSIIFQFLPNVLIFVSMYIVIPSALSYLSKFERHLTVSAEQRAALLKMVCFFLVNLILLRALVESSLEGAILKMGRCYLDGEDCKRIEQYMSASFLSRSCLSSLAFLITSTFLGISYDLLAPIPWIKNKLQKFRKNDMLQLVPEQSEDYPLDNQGIDSLQRSLLSERTSDTMVSNNVQGDSTKLQAIFTLGLLVMYKLLPSDNDIFQPALLEGIQTVDNVVDGPIDYEIYSLVYDISESECKIFSQPKCEWIHIIYDLSFNTAN